MSEGAEVTGLSGRAARGAAWIFAARTVMRLLGFVNTIILARLLAPADFGVVAVALTAMQLLQGFSDIGVSQAVVRFRDADRDDLDTLFTLSALRGALIAALLFIVAPFAASFYGDQRMFWVFAGVGIYPLLAGHINPKFFEFERDLDFSKEFVSSGITKFIGVVVSIAIALTYRTYWAIILGLVASGAVQLVLSYVMRPYLPRLTFSSVRKVFGFSSWLFGVSFMAALNNKLDAFVLARAVGPAGTGVYYVGFQLSELPTTELASPIARAIYPGLAAMQSNVERMRAAYLKGVEALSVVAMPAAFGFAFVAAELIQLLLGAKWEGAAPVIEVLAPVLGLQTLFVATQFYAMALGLTRLVFFRELIFFGIRFPVFVWGAFAHGLIGAIAATASCGLIHVALNLGIYSRASRRPFFEPLLAARRSFGAVAAMAAYFLLIEPNIAAIAEAGEPVHLVANIAAGAFIYLGALYAFWRAEGSPPGVEATAIAIVGSALRRLRSA
jgi:PST family polysaccharide transporter